MIEWNLFGQPVSWLEVIAMFTGVIGVWLTIKKNIFCFPIGIINVILYAWLFFTPGVRLYADALLQCFYIILLSYGWFMWNKNDLKKDIKRSTKINLTLWLKIIFVFLVGTILLSLFLERFTNATYPWLDSSLTCSSLIAQWMIAKKMIENWIVWIVVNIIYIPLYVAKHLPLTAIFYSLLLLLAFRGYAEWKKNMRNYAD